MGKYRKIEKVNYWKGMSPREKVDYFFQYYAGWTVVAIVAVALIILGIYQIATNYKPDLEAMLISDDFFYDSETEEMEKALNAYTVDRNGDGHIVTELVSIVFYNNSEYNMAEYNSNLQQKMVIMLSTGTPRILIVSPEKLDYLLESGLVLADNKTVLIKDSILCQEEAFRNVPDDYLVCMIEMGENLKKNEKNLSKRNYTYEYFCSIIK